MKNFNLQNYNFNLIRAAACLLVCISHIFITQAQNIELYKNFVGIGQIGVGMFFFISGYLIMASLQRYNAKSFAIHRILRIYPVMTFITLLMLGIYYFYGLSPRCGEFGRSTALAQLFLVSDIFGKCHFLAVQWTLFIEIKFYILIALAFYLSKNIKQFLCLFYGLIFTVCAICFFKNSLLAANTGGGIMFISLGVLYYLQEKKVLNLPEWSAWNILVLFLGGLIFLGPQMRNMEAINLEVGYLICLLILNLKFKPRKIVNFFADISYPLYLIHAFTSLDNFSFVERGLIFLVMIGVSWLIHILIEKPGIEFSKRITLPSHKPKQINQGLIQVIRKYRMT